jgi:hypothetical protein
MSVKYDAVRNGNKVDFIGENGSRFSVRFRLEDLVRELKPRVLFVEECERIIAELQNKGESKFVVSGGQTAQIIPTKAR